MSAIMSDVVTGAMTPQQANAICNAGGKMLKVVEMEHKYGKAAAADAQKRLELTHGT